jgi:mRNA interferase HigB
VQGVRLIAWKNLREYAATHPQTVVPLERWAERIYVGEWSSMAAIVAAFPKSKTVSGERIRFDIGGGDFRLIVAFNIKRQIAFVKFIGVHAEYDRVDAASVEMF